MREILKRLLSHSEYRIINRRRRWGIDLIDDLKKLKSADQWKVIFDVGANCGQSAIRFSDAFSNATILSFEPFSDSFRALSAVARKIGHAKVIPYNFALSDHDGEAQFRVFPDGAKNTLIAELSDSMRGGETIIAVKTHTLDSFCKDENIGNIDLLKIDVEGAELQVLRGAADKLSREQVSFVYAEFHLFSDGQSSGSGTGGHTAFNNLTRLMETYHMRPLSIYTDNVHFNEPIGTYNVLFGPI